MYNIEDIKNKIIQGDCIEVMKEIPDNSIDTIITDPPYGLSNHREEKIRETLKNWLNGKEDFIPDGKGFMGKSWDSFVPPPIVWKECFRVMKPGATILVFAGTRTYDLMTISLRLAGFEVKDTLMWLYSQGFPKSLNIEKSLQKRNKCGNMEVYEET
jgi:site-specific DNA-methyltransferase (adenine-specific)